MLDVGKHSRNNLFRKNRVLRLHEMTNHVVSKQNRCRIIDIGGTYMFWRTWHDFAARADVDITCINKEKRADAEFADSDSVRMITGDARNLDLFEDREFDIAFSNSVIEHVGMWKDIQAMANEVRRVAKYYIVQTPYYWFPIEPHARTPFIHWLPESIKYRIVMWKKCGYWDRQRDVGQAVQKVQAATLLDIKQFSYLFPDGRIHRERVYGLVKSLLAVKGP